MAFEQHQEGEFTVIEVDESRLDASIAESFKTFAFDLIESGNEQLVINLSEVRFMDSSGLGALVAAFKKLAGKGSFSLAAPQPAVRDLFDLTSMDKLFTVHDSVAGATGGN